MKLRSFKGVLLLAVSMAAFAALCAKLARPLWWSAVPETPTVAWGVQKGSEYIQLSASVLCDPRGAPCLATRGETQGGARVDAFVEVYDPRNPLRPQLLFTSSECRRVLTAVRDTAGIYVAGEVWKNGGLSPSIIIAKLTITGRTVWQRRLPCSATDFRSLIATRDSLYAVGGSPYVVKFDLDGQLVWAKTLRLIGISSICNLGAADVDPEGNLYIVGTLGNGSGVDRVFLAKFDSSGRQVWLRRWSPGDASAVCMRVTRGGSIYLGGSIASSDRRPLLQRIREQWFSGGRDHCIPGGSVGYVRKCDSRGREKWTRMTAAGPYDLVTSLAVDSAGSVYCAGRAVASASLKRPVLPHAFAMKIDHDGRIRWRAKMASGSWDEATGIAVDNVGSVYVCGRTAGELYSKNSGGNDVFLAKLAQPN